MINYFLGDIIDKIFHKFAKFNFYGYLNMFDERLFDKRPYELYKFQFSSKKVINKNVFGTIFFMLQYDMHYIYRVKRGQ